MVFIVNSSNSNVCIVGVFRMFCDLLPKQIGQDTSNESRIGIYEVRRRFEENGHGA